MTPCHVCTLAPCRCDAVLAGIALVGAGLLLAAGPRVRSAALGVFVNGLFLLPPAASEPEEPGADFDRRVVTIASCRGCWPAPRGGACLLTTHAEPQLPDFLPDSGGRK